MMQIVPLQALPNQIVNIALNDQSCAIKVYQKFYGLFIDLYVDEQLVIGGVICEDRNRIVRSKYLGFDGDLAFFDTVGNADPSYETLGAQFLLAYFTEDDIQLLRPD